jgi:hypothetical protein
MKKKFAAYGLHNSRIVPLRRCSSTNFCISSCSMRFSGRSHAGRVAGAFGRSSMAWSHTVCFSNHWDFSLLKTFLCCWYSLGIFPFSGTRSCLGWIITLPMKYLGSDLTRGTFFVRGTNIAFCAFRAHKTMGSWVWSIHPFFQLILGCTAANHGYLRIALCSPKSDKKKCNLLATVPVCASKSA